MSEIEKYHADVKKKARANVIDEIAINLTKQILPNYWTIRDYKPDYGIDLAIETFDNYNLETLGEHFFVQVKGQEKVRKGKIKIKGKLQTYLMDVVKFSLETDLLFTVQRMGHACPVMLFVVDITEKTIYFINLNDYIDKIFLDNNIDFTHQAKITINIPLTNKIQIEKDANLLFFFSKRAKFYSFFETVQVQLYNFSIIYDYASYIQTAIRYAKQLLTFDIISSKKSERYFLGEKENLIDISNGFLNFFKNSTEDNEVKEWNIYLFNGLYTKQECELIRFITSTWEQLNTIQGIHEDSWRKSFLPTDYLAMLQSDEM